MRKGENMIVKYEQANIKSEVPQGSLEPYLLGGFVYLIGVL